jgi:type IV pilus assembly protein PilC
LSEQVKRKAVAAAVYPAFLVGVMLTVTSILLVFVIPRFEEFYAGLGAQLPLATRVLVAVGRNVQKNMLVLGIAAGFGAVLTAVWWRRPGSAAQLDRILLRVPALGHLMRIYATSQLARTLSTLLAGGLPLLDALDVAGNSVGNRAVGQSILRATPLIREGKSLTAALESTGHIENLGLEMVRVGEQTGALVDMLGAIAEFYDEELESRMATTMALIEPLMVVTMAVLVTLMLLAFYLPLFQSFMAAQQRG